MTIIRLSGGDLGEHVAYVRCDLSQASSPVLLWDENCEQWDQTQYQCADARHRVSGLVYLGLAILSGDLETSLTVCDHAVMDADTQHDDALVAMLCGT